VSYIDETLLPDERVVPRSRSASSDAATLELLLCQVEALSVDQTLNDPRRVAGRAATAAVAAGR